MTDGPQLTAAILRAIAPLVDGESTETVVEAVAGAMLATVLIASEPDMRQTILRRYVELLNEMIEKLP